MELVNDILDRYSIMVYRLAYSRTKNSYDAEDIMQEVFVKYMKQGNKFESENHLKSWLLRVTINASKDLLRSAWFRKTTKLEDVFSVELEENSEVYKYVLKLPKKYRTVIHLFYYEDMAIAEIGKVLDINEATIRSQLHRGRKLLKEVMKGECFDV